MNNIPQLHKMSRASQLSLLAVVILMGAVFFTVNSALEQQNQSSNASGSANMLINPSFESGASPWWLNLQPGGAGQYTVTSSQHEDGSYAAQVNITGATSNGNDWWYVQLEENNLPIKQGQTYTVTYWAKASSSRYINGEVQNGSSPYQAFYESQNFITTSWQQFSYTFTATSTVSNGFVGFNLASATGTVWIDNVSLSQTSVAPTSTPIPTIQQATIVPTAIPTSTPTPYPTSTPIPTVKPTPTGSLQVLPTNTPIPTPTAVPTPTPIAVATSIPTPTTVAATPLPTSTPIPGATEVSVLLGLQGIGTAGDSANPDSVGNMNPLHPTRTITMQVYDSSNTLVASQEGTVQFDSSTGDFEGTVNLGTTFQTGLYTVKIQSPQYLRALVPGIQTITQGQVVTLPLVTLVTGDINGDNQINILDYNILMGCYSDLLPATNCTAANDVLSDLNDDGAVNEIDYNLFLRELTNIGGQ